ncbi:MAG: CHASE2 domain-containing protein [Miltoncostaeaceae bacterium]
MYRLRETPLLWAALVAALAVAAGSVLAVSGVLDRAENATVDARFQLRPADAPSDVAVVAIDDITFSRTGLQWPFPRSLHAEAVDRLTAAGARTIVYDVQFTEATEPEEDLALYDAIAASDGVVLATSEIGDGGTTNVLGGDENLAAAGAEAGASNLVSDSGEIIRRFPYEVGGLRSLAVVTAERAGGVMLQPSDFSAGGAWIDYRGPPRTVPTIPFVDLIEGTVPGEALRDKVVVVGATAPALQDIHPTPTSDSTPMAGPEVQANAIWTALRDLPLRSPPWWATALAVALLAIIPPLAGLSRRFLVLVGVTAAAAAAYVGLAWLLFGQGLVVSVVVPLATLLIAAIGTLVGGAMVESRLRLRQERRAEELEVAVRERTTELRHAQREIVERLGRAAEWREEQTGQHVVRVGRLCEALALELGLSAGEAETIRMASALHDLGKIGVPDRVLLHDGPLDDEGWAIIRTHPRVGSGILADSTSELVQVAEQIAHTHHEKFDGSGYPDGLSGEDIPLAGRICAVCDVFDALCSPRPYKDGWELEAVMAEIQASAGSHFDPVMAEAFLRIAPGFYAELGYSPTEAHRGSHVAELLAAALDEGPSGHEDDTTEDHG